MEPGATLVGRYRVDRLLGRGGMGAVYEATHITLARKVAIKILDTADVAEDAIRATEREALAAGQLAHPHIVQVTDFSPGEGGPPFLVMELLQGESLAARLSRSEKLHPEAAAFIMVQVLSALAAAHASGIVHRDVKPANIFLTSTAATHDFVKLLDFGIAWSAGAVSRRDSGSSTAGTPQYMAPEQVRGDDVDARTDIWAVGVCLYEMLAGEAPFDGDNVAQLLMRICNAKPPPLEDSALGEVVLRALAKDPVGRFVSAEQMRLALAPFARSAPIPSKALGGTAEPPLKEFASTIPASPTTIGAPPTPPVEGTRPSGPSPLATMPSSPSTPPKTRRRWPIPLMLAMGALVVAAVVLARRRPVETLQVVPKCALAGTPAAWSVGVGRISIAAKDDSALIAFTPQLGPPRFAKVTPEGLTEWTELGALLGAEDASAANQACATIHGGSLVGAVFHPQSPRLARGALGMGAPADEAGVHLNAFVFTHRPYILRCASEGTPSVFVSFGADAPSFLTDEPSVGMDAIRLISVNGTKVIDETLQESEAVVDHALALRGDRAAALLLFSTAMEIRGFEARTLVVTGRGKLGVAAAASGPTIDLLPSTILATWVEASKLHWAALSNDIHLEKGGVLVDEDVISPTFVVRGDRVILAYGVREGGRVAIRVGSGASLPDAAQATVKVTTTADQAPQIRLANAVKPWLAWTDGDGVRATTLSCP